MAMVNIQQLVLAGAHFGHLTRRWNPKMKKYIFMEKNGIYIIDLNQTVKLMEKAHEAIEQIAAKGETILFVGTKKQAREIMKSEATRAGMPYVNERWLGGMLTNFSTIRKSIKKLEGFEKMVVDGTYERISKKERLNIDKLKEKLDRNLGGIRHMRRLPSAMFVVDTLQEDIAIREARKLGIPIFAILDTNCDPDNIDYPIPANDDAYKSIGLITKTFVDALVEGAAVYQAKKADEPAPKQQHKGGGGDKDKQRGPRRRRGGAGQKGRKPEAK
jgi:small subunit ribosomal protein S2